MFFREKVDEWLARWEAANIDPPLERTHQEDIYENYDEDISQHY